jgi:hypothetical protein
MKELFSNSLRKFSLSIDIVNEEIWKNTLKTIVNYLDQLLNIYLYGLLKSQLVNDNPGLNTFWHKNGKNRSYEIMKDGKYKGQVSYAFDKDTKLWIVAGTEKKPLFLNDAADFINLWDNRAQELPSDFPEFDATHKKKIMTSIILPLKRTNVDKPWGILNLESEKRLFPSQLDKNELENIVTSMSTLYHLKVVNEEMLDRSQRSLDKTNTLVQKSIFEKQKQKTGRKKENAIFVAYADKADEEVISIIRKAVKNFENKIKPYFWKDMNRIGNTFDLIWEKINSCCLGICYFAECIKQNKYGEQKNTNEQKETKDCIEFRYNPNVLVEAGMMQAITTIENEGEKEENIKAFDWLPIRESSMENIYYLYPQKAVIVERDKTGKISNPEDIATKIKSHLKHYLHQNNIK